MARSSNTSNILLALQIATMLAEAKDGDDEAQLEALQYILDVLTLKVAYLRNNPEFAKALSDQITKELTNAQNKRHRPQPDRTEAPPVPVGTPPKSNSGV